MSTYYYTYTQKSRYQNKKKLHKYNFIKYYSAQYNDGCTHKTRIITRIL